ncbi:MAG: hypothetical protein J5589_11485 [Firmicutes bacterium]|nr:hypothetical protein [Bacillota bacterium]
MAKPSYQQMAAHFAALAGANAPKENNTYIALRDFYEKLNRKLLMFDTRNTKVYGAADNLAYAITRILKEAQALAEASQAGDEEKTKKQLDVTAAACENFDKCLSTFKKDGVTDPHFSNNHKDVKLFETAKYDQGLPILQAAGVSAEDLKSEDIEEIKENLDEDTKETLNYRIKFNEKKAQKIAEDEKYKNNSEEKELYALHERAEQYVLYAQRPIEPVAWTKKETQDSKREYQPSPLDIPTEEKSWKNYRILHLRGVDPSQENFQENLAKSIVATFQMTRPQNQQNAFSVKLARSQAQQLMNLPTFKTFCQYPSLVRKYLNGDKLFQACGGLFRPFHLTDKNKGIEILQALKKMPEKMDDPKNQSKEWKALIKTLKNIDPYVDDAEQEKQLQAAYDATAAYMKGRKSVRSTQEEQNQFDQSMDVLATLAKANDFAKVAANVIVDRTNEVRDRIFHKHQSVSLGNYGEDKLEQHMNQDRVRRDSLGDIELGAPSNSNPSL